MSSSVKTSPDSNPFTEGDNGDVYFQGSKVHVKHVKVANGTDRKVWVDTSALLVYDY